MKNEDLSSTIRVDIRKLDNLMNLVGELLINKSRLESMEVKHEKYDEIMSQLDRVTMELHHMVMQIRMVPINVVFKRFPRLVRDLAKKHGKKINLKIKGEETELDRSIIDELFDPLIMVIKHLVKNSIESPEKRKKQGKNTTGNLSIRASQKGDTIIIEIEDDGNGKDLKDMEGLEKVKGVVEKLDGEVKMASRKEEGSLVEISLPLTMAITEALMVEIGGDVFAIPLTAVRETLRVSKTEVQKIKGQSVITLREQTVSLLEASRSLNLGTKSMGDKEELAVVIVQAGAKQVGLIVDDFLYQQEIVIKSLSTYLNDVKNISGATIIGDGEIALILDVRNIA